MHLVTWEGQRADERQNAWSGSGGSPVGTGVAVSAPPSPRTAPTPGVAASQPAAASPGAASPADEPRTHVELRGVRFNRLTQAETVLRIVGALTDGQGGFVVTPNLDHLRRCVRDPHYKALVGRADLVVADGMPLVWASRLAGSPLPERVAGSDLISSLSAAAAARGRSVFLLGGVDGSERRAAEILRARYPGLSVAGTLSPPFGFEDDPAEIARIEAALVAAAPDIVYVGLGSPKQERLIERLRPLLPRAWWLGVGISFSFLSGDVPRAPRWMQRVGLEWVHRMWREPRRLAWRYCVEGIPFALRTLVDAAVRGVAGPGRSTATLRD